MKWNFSTLVVCLFSILALAGSSAVADDKADSRGSEHAHGSMEKEPSPEMRKQMAEMHQMMADCLKSEKTMAECKKEMKQNCPMMKDGGKCHMMGMMDETHTKHKKAGKGKRSAAKDSKGHEGHH